MELEGSALGLAGMQDATRAILLGLAAQDAATCSARITTGHGLAKLGAGVSGKDADKAGATQAVPEATRAEMRASRTIIGLQRLRLSITLNPGIPC